MRVSTSKSSETPDASDGNGLAEKLLGLDGPRLIAVAETEPTTRCLDVERLVEVAGSGSGPTRDPQ